MQYLILYRNDIKQIVRDPIMIIMLIAPLLMIGLFKMILIFLLPFLTDKTGFDVSPYFVYILAFVLLMIPGLLGIVTGFMMLDERDGNIAELMTVTPLGRNGYLINRLSFSAILSVIYCFIAYYVLNIYTLPLTSLIYITLLLALYSAIIGLLIFSGADDKVKGLTFAKALNILNIFAFADLFSLKWMTVISWFFPSYWITGLIKNPDSLLANSMVFIVHGIWFGVLVRQYWRKDSIC